MEKYGWHAVTEDRGNFRVTAGDETLFKVSIQTRRVTVNKTPAYLEEIITIDQAKELVEWLQFQTVVRNNRHE